MDLTALLFYCGIAGMIASAVLGISTVIAMRRKKKKLRDKLNAEYGEPFS